MSITETLRDRCRDDWDAATSHAFTDALARGDLDPSKMAAYLQQDYLFLEGFVRLLSAAISAGPSLSDITPSAQFLGLVCGPENTYFQRSFKALDVPSAPSVVAPETKAFQAHMEAARLSGKYENMMAVLVVAEWVYLSWAAPVEDRADDLPFWFGEWITLHAGDGFEGVVAHFRGQLDKVWSNLDDAAQADATEFFTKTVELERAFFDAAWAGFPDV